MKLMSMRTTSLLKLLVVIASFGAVAYLQAYKGFEPCPLCLLQRYVMIILGILFFLGIFVYRNKPAQFLIHFFALLFSSLGVLLAGRQVWLEHLPPNPNAGCGASLEYMLQAFPLQEVLQKIIEGTPDCAKVSFQFLHVSLAGWSLLAFAFLGIVTFWQLCRVFCRG
jgi:disulfide bond formation protein DsbB